MVAPVRSTFLGALNVNATDAVLYTVPAGKRTIVKNIHVMAYSAAGATVQLQHENAANAVQWFVIGPTALAQYAQIRLMPVWIVLDQGHKLRFKTQAGIAYCAASGVELELP